MIARSGAFGLEPWSTCESPALTVTPFYRHTPVGVGRPQPGHRRPSADNLTARSMIARVRRRSPPASAPSLVSPFGPLTGGSTGGACKSGFEPWSTWTFVPVVCMMRLMVSPPRPITCGHAELRARRSTRAVGRDRGSSWTARVGRGARQLVGWGAYGTNTKRAPLAVASFF